MNGRTLRILEDEAALPVVEVVSLDGTVTHLAAPTLDDQAAEELAAVLHRGLTGCVVRIVRIPRVAVLTRVEA